MQGTALSAVGYITVDRPVRCRQPNGGADRAQPCDHAASVHFAKRRRANICIRAPVSPRAVRGLAVPMPRIGHPSGV